jgi:NAD(P)-dependent dehydrogenase (short-subunit alcohol dehydrogenase family)
VDADGAAPPGGRFAGRGVVVTGGTRGIGAACAALVAREGGRVVIVGRDRAAGEAVFRSSCTSGHVLQADLGQGDQIDDVVQRAERLLGGVDVLLNVAGTAAMKRSVNVRPAEVEHMMSLNANALLLLCVGIGRAMVERRRGAIVNVTSIAALGGAPFQVAYAASKAAAEGITRTLAAEWAPSGIRVNAVAPGIIRTDMTRQAWSSQDVEDATAGNVPMGRLGTADEVARAVAFLASDDASYITGHTLVVDGGVTGHYDLTRGRHG